MVSSTQWNHVSFFGLQGNILMNNAESLGPEAVSNESSDVVGGSYNEDVERMHLGMIMVRHAKH